MEISSSLGIEKNLFIGVIGTSQPSKNLYQIAYQLGKEIGKRKWLVICGGLGGVMEAVAKGVKESGSLTIGILPQDNKTFANPYIDIPIATGLNEARNLIIVFTADIIIAVGKGYGTLQEIAFALKCKKPIIGLKTWNKNLPIIKAKSVKEVINKIHKLQNIAYFRH